MWILFTSWLAFSDLHKEELDWNWNVHLKLLKKWEKSLICSYRYELLFRFKILITTKYDGISLANIFMTFMT